MPKFIEIKLTNPCQQSWEEMTPQVGGKFCGSCQKTVTDFTGMTDNQLIEFFKQNRQDGCGRFHTDQLHSPLPMPAKKIPWIRYMLQISIPAMLMTLKASSQRLVSFTTTSIQVMNKGTELRVDVPVSVTGQVKDLGGQPVPFASVIVAESSRGTAADENGWFTLELGPGERAVEISSVGFETKKLVVSRKQFVVTLSTPLAEDVTVLADMRRRTCNFIGGGYSIIRTSVKQIPEIKTGITSASDLTVFPNPVSPKGIITIDWKKALTGDQQVKIFNSGGQFVASKELVNLRGVRQSQIQLNLTGSGVYIMTVIDKKTAHKRDVSFLCR